VKRAGKRRSRFVCFRFFRPLEGDDDNGDNSHGGGCLLSPYADFPLSFNGGLSS
jgi:hypothetical protein